MFYRQAALFVPFLADRDRPAFRRMLRELRDVSLADGLREHLGTDLDSAWAAFRAGLD